jgi:hypothetical protein
MKLLVRLIRGKSWEHFRRGVLVQAAGSFDPYGSSGSQGPAGVGPSERFRQGLVEVGDERLDARLEVGR